MSDSRQYHVLTRDDMDGVACGVLLSMLRLVDRISFVHPRDIQDGLIELSEENISASLPYAPGAFLSFDHHLAETLRVGRHPNFIVDPDARSTARVIYQHFGGPEAFPKISEEFLRGVDKAASADYTMDEVLSPERWTLLNFVVDQRTGLGSFGKFRVSHAQLLLELIDFIPSYSIEDLLESPDIKQRTNLYFQHEPSFRSQLASHSELVGHVLVTDFRGADVIYPGNRFLKYALFPSANVSIQVSYGFENQSVVFSVGKSIFNRTSNANIGVETRRFGGGGHRGAGTCQVPLTRADEALAELVERLQEAEGPNLEGSLPSRRGADSVSSGSE